MAKKEKFRISSALKDIIGRDLITNEFVAIFELVKNSFDAHATRVDIEFDKGTITIIDDGKGMSEEDILEKWLFVAYSAKRLDTEDENLSQDFRNKISVRRGYAGNKGIGRFSCDRLGENLDLYSRSENQSQVQHLEVDWTSFEGDAHKEFATVDVALSTVTTFPNSKKALKPKRHGTMLVISDLRQDWHQEKIEKLRAYLAKLVNPFAPTSNIVISTFVAFQNWPDAEGVVGNNIAVVLNEKTTRIEVAIEGGIIVSSLIDRGSQYASKDFRRLLKAHGYKGSMSRKGDCWDNAVAESFFGSLKQERVQWRHYQTRYEAQQDILDYISMFYNGYRLHSTLGYMSPNDFEAQLPMKLKNVA